MLWCAIHLAQIKTIYFDHYHPMAIIRCYCIKMIEMKFPMEYLNGFQKR